jgi:phage gp16-like protein
MSDAAATVKFSISMGIVDSSSVTGLRAGYQADALAEAVYDALIKPHTRWAMKKLVEELEAAEKASHLIDGREKNDG